MDGGWACRPSKLSLGGANLVEKTTWISSRQSCCRSCLALSRPGACLLSDGVSSSDAAGDQTRPSNPADLAIRVRERSAALGHELARAERMSEKCLRESASRGFDAAGFRRRRVPSSAHPDLGSSAGSVGSGRPGRLAAFGSGGPDWVACGVGIRLRGGRIFGGRTKHARCDGR